MKARLHSDSGQTLIWFALSLVVLLGIAALAVDVGRLYGERRRMQNAADAAALAGAHEVCLDNDAAVEVADYYARQNGAQWATPEPFGEQGTTGKGMDVTVGKTVNNLFAIFLNANSTTVSARAKARCEKTQTGCATWPLSLDMDKFTKMQCDDPFVVSFDPDFDATNCPPGCDCSHVFTRPRQPNATPQVGWTNNDAAIEVGQCAANRIGMTGSNLVNWYGDVPVRIPLFDGSCSGGYNIAGFGCFVLTSPAYESQGMIPNCNTPIREVINAKVDCNCTISCGSAGGLPEQMTDATIPVLVQ